MSRRTFGIELETVDLSREEVAEIAASCLGGAIVDDSHSDDIVLSDSSGRLWHVVKDGSLSRGGAELVSCVLGAQDSDDEALSRCAPTLSSKGAESSASSSCGIHVHVGCGDLDAKTLAFALVHWMFVERIVRALVTSRNRESTCKELPDRYRMAMRQASRKAAFDENALKRATYTMLGGDGDVRVKFDESRYHSVNVHSWFYTEIGTTHRRKTLEFRVFDGTLDGDKLWLYPALCRAIVDRAVAGEEPQGASTPTELVSLLSSWGLPRDRVEKALGVPSVREIERAQEALSHLAPEVATLGEQRDILLSQIATADDRKDQIAASSLPETEREALVALLAYLDGGTDAFASAVDGKRLSGLKTAVMSDLVFDWIARSGDGAAFESQRYDTTIRLPEHMRNKRMLAIAEVFSAVNSDRFVSSNKAAGFDLKRLLRGADLRPFFSPLPYVVARANAMQPGFFESFEDWLSEENDVPARAAQLREHLQALLEKQGSVSSDVAAVTEELSRLRAKLSVVVDAISDLTRQQKEHGEIIRRSSIRTPAEMPFDESPTSPKDLGQDLGKAVFRVERADEAASFLIEVEEHLQTDGNTHKLHGRSSGIDDALSEIDMALLTDTEQAEVMRHAWLALVADARGEIQGEDDIDELSERLNELDVALGKSNIRLPCVSPEALLRPNRLYSHDDDPRTYAISEGRALYHEHGAPDGTAWYVDSYEDEEEGEDEESQGPLGFREAAELLNELVSEHVLSSDLRDLADRVALGVDVSSDLEALVREALAPMRLSPDVVDEAAKIASRVEARNHQSFAEALGRDARLYED